jgi:mannose-6-phosphate isomerase-like protein (cupin superfamily)
VSVSAEQRRIYRFEEADWHLPMSKGVDPEKLAAAGDQGVGRRFLAQGEGGYYAQVVRMPAGFSAPSHAHDHAEIFMVLEGSCSFDGQQMDRFDMTVVSAGSPYSFVAGDDGVQFLVVRPGKADFQEVQA